MPSAFRLSVSRPLLAAVAVLTLAAPPAQAIDWSGVPNTEVMLFYPGQASWEWVLTESDHSAAKKFREGKNCAECHRTEEAEMGARIVSGEKLEPAPIPGKRGSIKANVQMAHDGDRLYVRIAWPEATEPQGPKMDPEAEAMVTMMLGDDNLVEAKRAGCWGACHDDANGMASAPQGKEITKYLARSRTKITRQGGGENFKEQSALDKMLQDGQFLEYWHAHVNKGAAAHASHGYILEKRHESESPAVAAEASFADGSWTVVLSRKLAPGRPGHKDIVPGQTTHVGFAIHDAYAEHRFHHVSFEHTLVLDKGEADFIAPRK